MKDSLRHDPAGIPSTPSSEVQPAASVRERDRLWSSNFTQQELDTYATIAFNIAYLILQNKDEALDVASSVFEELCRKRSAAPNIPLEAQIRVLARSRAIDRRDSSPFKLRQNGQPLYAINGDGEERESLPASLTAQGPEDIAVRREEDAEYMDRLARAVGTLDPDRRTCFVLRYVEGLKPKQFAGKLGMTTKRASALACSAREEVLKLLQEEGV
jgi:RNA polymerase sigma factor (sigma-70 family)